MLYLLATPIGNLEDITVRALNVLKEVDAIICEDTRRTLLLLNHYQIKKPLLVLNDFNEAKVTPVYLERLKKGENIALVSDAGTPLIADPGFKLVRAALESQILVDSVPGPSAILTALILSGLPPHHFVFLNYLPEKPKARIDALIRIRNIDSIQKFTYIILVSPYKLITTLKDIESVFGDIQIVLAKELTKVHQLVKSQKVSKWISEYEKAKPKGEYILLFNLSSSRQTSSG